MDFVNSFPVLESTVLQRRTTKKFNGKPIEKEVIKKLLTLAIWAPNHRLNEPWRFRVLSSSGLQRWADYLKTHLDADSQKVYQKKIEDLTQAGALVFVTCLKDENETITLENFAATCAGVQNLLLGATALQIATYWSTGKLMTEPLTLHFLEIPDNEQFVGAIWLGYGDSPGARARTDLQEKTKWID